VSHLFSQGCLPYNKKQVFKRVLQTMICRCENLSILTLLGSDREIPVLRLCVGRGHLEPACSHKAASTRRRTGLKGLKLEIKGKGLKGLYPLILCLKESHFITLYLIGNVQSVSTLRKPYSLPLDRPYIKPVMLADLMRDGTRGGTHGPL
jgi:hypothetical protein